MRLIGNLPEKQLAETFVAYLITQSIHSHVEEEQGRFEIWIKDEDQVDRAVELLGQFKSDPTSQTYSQAREKAREIQNEEIRKRQRIRKNMVDVPGRFGRRKTPLTVMLIVICAIVALMTNFGRPDSMIQPTFRALAFSAESPTDSQKLLARHNEDTDALPIRLSNILAGQGWRLVTPIFIHHDVFHLLFNMYWLFLFGSQIENRYSTLWLGILVLVSAAISNFMQCVVPSAMGGSAPFLLNQFLINGLGGMSGVVYALFGFVWMRSIYDRSSGMSIPQSTVFILVAWLIFCITPLSKELLNNSVANWAHVVGLLVGVVAGYWPMLMGRK